MQALGLVWDSFDPLTVDLSETITLKSSPDHPGARLLFERWEELRPSGGLVVGRDLPSRELRGILRNLAVFEPLDGAKDFRARLAGTAFLRRFGRDITGLRLSRIFQPAEFESHRRIMAQVAETGAPMTFDVRVQRGLHTFLLFEALRLPVSPPDRSGTWILSGLFHYD